VKHELFILKSLIFTLTLTRHVNLARDWDYYRTTC